MRKLETNVTSSGDTRILISENEFSQRWAEVKEGPVGKEVTLHFNSKEGYTHKHESITLFPEDIKSLAAIL